MDIFRRVIMDIFRRVIMDINSKRGGYFEENYGVLR